MTKKRKIYITIEIRESYIDILKDILRCLRWIDIQNNIGFRIINFRIVT